MVTLLGRLLIRQEGREEAEIRKAYGILCGAVGIFFNVLLFAGKFFAGTLSGSIAITADAFNNLSDAGASIVTLLGFKLAGQKPDPEHPFGHGRLEYISGLIVSMVILLMGIELAKSAVEKILHPEAVEFTLLTGGILLASVITMVIIAVIVYLSAFSLVIKMWISGRKKKKPAHTETAESTAEPAVLQDETGAGVLPAAEGKEAQE